MKRKFSLLINIATLVLCISAIAIGVYSAKTASLNVSGSIGFVAHNCKVAVTGTIVGHATTPNGTPETKAQPITGVTVPDKATLDLGEVYFSDLTGDGTINPIKLILYFENQSDFDVKVDITPQTIEDVEIRLDKTTLTLSDKSAAEADKKKFVEVTLTCESTSTGITPPVEGQQILQVNMAKYTAPQATGLTVQSGSFDVGEEWDESVNDYVTRQVERTYVTMGKYKSQTENIKWYIFAQGDGTNMTAVNGTVDNNGTLPAGTYWFISEYVLEKRAFDDSSYQYSGSDIQLYLNGTGANSFITTYGINSSNPVYSKIIEQNGRDLPREIDSGVVGDFEGVEKQTFWLLSYGEFDLLTETRVAYDISSSAESSWLLRSVNADYDGPHYVSTSSDSEVLYGNCSEVYGVRPAFQITIS